MWGRLSGSCSLPTGPKDHYELSDRVIHTQIPYINVYRMRPRDPVTWLLTTISPSIGRRPDATALGPVRHALGLEDPMRQETRLVSHCMWPPPGGLGLRACVTMQRTSLPRTTCLRQCTHLRAQYASYYVNLPKHASTGYGTLPLHVPCEPMTRNTTFVNDTMCVSNPRTLSGNSYCEDAYLGRARSQLGQKTTMNYPIG